MEDQQSGWKDLVISAIALIITFGFGGYLGYRIQQVHNFERLSQLEAEVIASSAESGTQEEMNIETISVPEVYWTAPGGESSCPQTHPIKAKFTSTGNVIYSPDHKSYKRVIAHLCFVSSEYAIQTANFFEKQN